MDQIERLLDRSAVIWRRQRVPAAPFFELTPRCTLDCKMCYVHLTPEQMGERRELTTEQWLQICEDAVRAGMLYTVLTGGECMLHPGFWDIYYCLLDHSVAVTVNTNAYAMTDADIARFQARAPAGFRVTLYAGSEEGYERCTGRRAFAKVRENLMKLRDAGFNVQIGMTLCRYNVDQVHEMIRTARELRIPYSYTIELTEPNADTGRHLKHFALTDAEKNQLLLELLREQNKAPSENDPSLTVPANLDETASKTGLTCGGGNSSYVIHWDGCMSPCFDLPGIAYVQELGFAAAWEETKRIAAAYRLPIECERCALRSVCEVCPIQRTDPKNPGHRDPARCKTTLERYRLGLVRLMQQKQGQT